MSKAWYVLQVLTGKELDIKDYCNKYGVIALVPMRLLQERRRGKWQNIKKVLMPGYVFINTDIKMDSWKNYYVLSETSGVVRFLKGANNEPETITEDEMGIIFALIDNKDLIGISEVVVEGDKIKVISGALCGYEGRIQSINARKHRAKVLISVAGKDKTIELAINQVKKSES